MFIALILVVMALFTFRLYALQSSRDEEAIRTANSLTIWTNVDAARGQILDRNGVGQLVREAVLKGRSTRLQLKCGICGEHGGEPSSVEFCHYAGLNYVSCSPFRVPIARLAAAHAALTGK